MLPSKSSTRKMVYLYSFHHLSTGFLILFSEDLSDLRNCVPGTCRSFVRNLPNALAPLVFAIAPAACFAAGVCPANKSNKSKGFVAISAPIPTACAPTAPTNVNHFIVDGDYDLAFDQCLEDSIKNKWYNRNTAYNPLTIEGKKSAAYDIFLQSKGIIPDVIFIRISFSSF